MQYLQTASMILFLSFLFLVIPPSPNHAQEVTPEDRQTEDTTQQEERRENSSAIDVNKVNYTPWVEDGITHQDVYQLTAKGQYATIPPRTDDYDHLSTFCYPSTPLSISLFWSSASMKMDLPTNNYQVYMGPNVSSVISLAEASESAWLYSQLPWRSKEFKLSPFEDVCIGVQTTEGYTITLQWKHVNYMMVAVTISGMALFWMAPTLCRNTFFHYTTGPGR